MISTHATKAEAQAAAHDAVECGDTEAAYYFRLAGVVDKQVSVTLIDTPAPVAKDDAL